MRPLRAIENDPSRAALAGGLAWQGSIIGLPGRYTRFYEWYAILAFLDIVLTWSVLRLGGAEANWIAAVAVQAWGVWGLIILKAMTVAAVVMIAEYVGRRRPGLGWGLAVLAIVLNLLPVVVGSSHLATLAGHASMPDYWVVMAQEGAVVF